MNAKIQTLIANFEQDIINIEADNPPDNYGGGFNDGLVAALRKAIEELKKL